MKGHEGGPFQTTGTACDEDQRGAPRTFGELRVTTAPRNRTLKAGWDTGDSQGGRGGCSLSFGLTRRHKGPPRGV